LLDRVLVGAIQSGATVTVLERGNPALLRYASGEFVALVQCYLWNLTHGGYPRDPGELRIQITGIPRITPLAGGTTVLMGWSEELKCFAAFDPLRHLGDMRGRSPSLQIKREVLVEALAKRRLAVQRRGNNEIAVAVPQSHLGVYFECARELHASSADGASLASLEVAVDGLTLPSAPSIPAVPRQAEIVQVMRRLRDRRFRELVTTAYRSRCAISGLSLGLLDAAHIVPVEDPRSTDEVCNGLALSALHHRAFDTGLIGIRRDHSVVISAKRLKELEGMGLLSGLEFLRASLPSALIVPESLADRPRWDYLIEGQILRGWREVDLT
jgi:putative restriction endonuclease